MSSPVSGKSQERHCTLRSAPSAASDHTPTSKCQAIGKARSLAPVAAGSSGAVMPASGVAPAAQSSGQSSGQKKSWKIPAAVAAALLIAALIGGGLFFRSRSASALTAKDTVVLADFVNTTGDAVFDGTLKQALAVQLEQSPYLNLLPESRVREALR